MTVTRHAYGLKGLSTRPVKEEDAYENESTHCGECTEQADVQSQEKVSTAGKTFRRTASRVGRAVNGAVATGVLVSTTAPIAFANVTHGMVDDVINKVANEIGYGLESAAGIDPHVHTRADYLKEVRNEKPKSKVLPLPFVEHGSSNDDYELE